jgi:hypothetical protein
MTPSLPCPNCGHVDDLETVNPIGIIADNATLWHCRCGILRAVAMGNSPRELVGKVIAADDTRDWLQRSLGYRKAG